MGPTRHTRPTEFSTLQYMQWVKFELNSMFSQTSTININFYHLFRHDILPQQKNQQRQLAKEVEEIVVGGHRGRGRPGKTWDTDIRDDLRLLNTT